MILMTMISSTARLNWEMFGLTDENKKRHPVTVIPARSAKIIAVKCNTGMKLVPGDFESNNFGNSGVHIVQARVSPSIDGFFYVTAINISNEEIEFSARTIIGNLKMKFPNH